MAILQINLMYVYVCVMGGYVIAIMMRSVNANFPFLYSTISYLHVRYLGGHDCTYGWPCNNDLDALSLIYIFTSLLIAYPNHFYYIFVFCCDLLSYLIYNL